MLDVLSKGILRKVYSGEIGVVGQGIDDQLEVRMWLGGHGMANRGHEINGKFVRLEGVGVGKGNVGWRHELMGTILVTDADARGLWSWQGC